MLIMRLSASENSIVLQQLVQILRYFSKQANILFLKCISMKAFVQPILNMLKIARNKMNKVKYMLMK